uniref:Uncharacterized protein n=1 Tax=Meloidogyne enterolobii TaxID=390850 RepID=A0A6V7W043_MELEN|nr:unnamed protein product [Meloidogyne enterolobii]CAD2180314.1 unnamed protein product [Meloidogyne enterolobii]
MIIVRCWLEKLFKWAFESAYFDDYGFNPKMINLLFDNDKTIPLKFHVQRTIICPSKDITKNKLESILERLVISEFLLIDFTEFDNVEQQRVDILLKTLINKGDKIRQVTFELHSSLSEIYDNIVEYLATSRDCSKIVPDIRFGYTKPINFKLSERAEKVKKSKDLKSTNYQISNIYHPEVKFNFYSGELEIESSTDIYRIIKM